MFKKFLDTNREDLLIKGAMLGGVTAGLIGGTVVDRLRKPKTNIVIQGETVPEPTEPEANPTAEEK
ncbi:hypothetical protein SEA_SLOOPYJOE_40 [Arthrobacter phage Sloopyjoe]|nr:hypothetical protein PBI_STAYER_40 [Arthrobacter phage Stayer]QFG09748.1 hypothetical protein PBI_SHIBA_39 [Arthrobacter phage Shiba]QFG10184.1 hypothetical protein PBI_EGAD_40 [Arthrobacter phage Egad]QFG11754.1 hypothetical protein PBI_SALK_40 [Arthrobacter phage Salk]QFG12637.1 hypothetical protein PBI_MICHELLE_40 [Arthrobacter phage Michelle]QFG14410.1 hypothetical protein PBI_STARLORD_40 [Arthrobacter phage StarLord]UVT31118.1 hypothetical protein PBI_LINDA_40 [Arthrobacter phage Lind